LRYSAGKENYPRITFGFSGSRIKSQLQKGPVPFQELFVKEVIDFKDRKAFSISGNPLLKQLGSINATWATTSRTIGRGQSQEQVEAFALQKAKRLAVEEAGTYISSLTVVVNYQGIIKARRA